MNSAFDELEIKQRLFTSIAHHHQYWSFSSSTDLISIIIDRSYRYSTNADRRDNWEDIRIRNNLTFPLLHEKELINTRKTHVKVHSDDIRTSLIDTSKHFIVRYFQQWRVVKCFPNRANLFAVLFIRHRSISRARYLSFLARDAQLEPCRYPSTVGRCSHQYT